MRGSHCLLPPVQLISSISICSSTAYGTRNHMSAPDLGNVRLQAFGLVTWCCWCHTTDQDYKTGGYQVGERSPPFSSVLAVQAVGYCIPGHRAQAAGMLSSNRTKCQTKCIEYYCSPKAPWTGTSGACPGAVHACTVNRCTVAVSRAATPSKCAPTVAHTASSLILVYCAVQASARGQAILDTKHRVGPDR